MYLPLLTPHSSGIWPTHGMPESFIGRGGRLMNWKKFMNEGDYQDYLLRALTGKEVEVGG